MLIGLCARCVLSQVQLMCPLTCWSWWARWWPQQVPPGPSGWCSLWPVWWRAGTAGSVSSYPGRPLVSGADQGTHPSLCACSGWQGYVSGRRSEENTTIELEGWFQYSFHFIHSFYPLIQSSPIQHQTQQPCIAWNLNHTQRLNHNLGWAWNCTHSDSSLFPHQHPFIIPLKLTKISQCWTTF